MHLRKLSNLKISPQDNVFVRLDLNVPMKDGKITDDTRIKAALPTIRWLLEQTNRIVLCSHLGRPQNKPDPAFTLRPVGTYLAELLEKDVLFVEDYASEPVSQVLPQLTGNELVLLENLRFHPGEKKNDEEFARQLTNGLHFYVDDAFGSMHRAHASVDAAAKLFLPEKRAAGLLVDKEIHALDAIRNKPEAPFAALIGGSKVSDKIGVILSLLDHCNHLLIGGAMAYTLLHFRGVNVGNSKIEADKEDLVQMIFRNAETRKVEIHLPEDHICADTFAQEATPTTVDGAEIPAGLMGLDIGPKTTARYKSILRECQTILWNGPMGVFEWPAFANGTMEMAQEVGNCRGRAVVGGGDSVAAVNQAGIADRIWHVSTGGGAALEYLEGKRLPGLTILEQRS